MGCHGFDSSEKKGQNNQLILRLWGLPEAGFINITKDW
jgi:hypothetical protein